MKSVIRSAFIHLFLASLVGCERPQEPVGPLVHCAAKLPPKLDLSGLVAQAKSCSYWCIVADFSAVLVDEQYPGRPVLELRNPVDLCAGSNSIQPLSRIAIAGNVLDESSIAPYFTSKADWRNASTRRVFAVVYPRVDPGATDEGNYFRGDFSLPVHVAHMGWLIDADERGDAHIDTPVGQPLVERATLSFQQFTDGIRLQAASTSDLVTEACETLRCGEGLECLLGTACVRVERVGTPDPAPECSTDSDPR